MGNGKTALAWSLRTSLLLGVALSKVVAAQARDLTFEERVQAQEAIERVYYSHQTGASHPFDEAVSRDVLERKVRTYLKQTIVLEKFWHTRVTADMLRRETERMTHRTRMPERLRELFAALGNDPSLIQECLARPALVDRLARNFFGYDSVIHAEARQRAEGLRADLANAAIDPFAAHPNKTLLHVVRAAPGEVPDGRPVGEAGPSSLPRFDGSRVEVQNDEFESWRLRAPGNVGEIGPVVEERERFVIRVLIDRRPDELRVASFSIDKVTWDEWWEDVRGRIDERSARAEASAQDAISNPRTYTEERWDPTQEGPTSEPALQIEAGSGCTADDTWENGSMDDLPFPRQGHTAVWTGSLMVVWGGSSGRIGTYLRDGGRYDPATDTWTPTSLLGAPSSRERHTAVWSGSLMLVWGGFGSSGSLDTGGRYDPVADIWTPTSVINAPSPRSSHTAIWTGSQMVVWGSTALSTGGRYDPATDTWSPTSTTNAPSGRSGHTAIWTGNLMIVWGGGSDLNTGGRYDPATDRWKPTSTREAPTGRSGHTAVWATNQNLMVVWGGTCCYDPDSGQFTFLETGGRYDPANDKWTPTSVTNAPAPRYGHTVIWTGSLAVVWGGNRLTSLNSGGRYNPTTDTWTPTAVAGLPDGRIYHTAVWTGALMVIWGGYDDDQDPSLVLGTGGRYDPATDTWSPTSMTNAPSPRYAHTAVWTGNLMVVWGGLGASPFESGGRYDPVGDTWTPTSIINAPSPRWSHTAVWTGNLMVVWGGFGGSAFPDTGGRYDPIRDTWSPTSLNNSPSPRGRHTAVWTGNLMIVWGGQDASFAQLDTGGRYEPSSDTWTPTSRTSAPLGRAFHTAVWTGSLMLVWGGFGGPGPSLNTGGRYDPATDVWTPIALEGAPSGRILHTAVWTDNLMVVWGGDSDGSIPNTGGRYEPSSDTWTPTSRTSAPFGRASHTAVWTGTFMVVWGGTHTVATNDGGRYCVICSLSTFYRDADGDSTGDPGHSIQACSQPKGYVPDSSDCNDADATVWGTPGEVQDQLFLDNVTLIWTAPSVLGGTTVVYDTIRSGSPADFGTSAACIASDDATTSTTDPAAPLTGSAFFYLTRAENSCPIGGQGSLGRDSQGTERTGRSCP